MIGLTFIPTHAEISHYYLILVEKPAEEGGAPLGGRMKLCEGDTRIGRAIVY